jgi:5-methylcytosine-specific restriction protein A
VRRQATVVDHVVPHRGSQRLFWDPRNWQPSCDWHHNSIKPELERQFEKGLIKAHDLRLDSLPAAQLSRERHKPAVGVDGFAIPGS